MPVGFAVEPHRRSSPQILAESRHDAIKLLASIPDQAGELIGMPKFQYPNGPELQQTLQKGGIATFLTNKYSLKRVIHDAGHCLQSDPRREKVSLRNPGSG